MPARPDQSFKRRHSLAAVLLCLIPLLGACAQGHEPLSTLLAHSKSPRSEAGYLSGLPHRRLAMATDISAFSSQERTALMRGLNSLIRTTNNSAPSARQLATVGVFQLLLGNPDRAVRSLEQAVLLDSQDAPSWNDLSVAYLAQADSSKSVLNLLKALEAVGKSREVDPNSVAGCFNQALVFGRLALRRQSAHTWRKCLAGPSYLADGWAAEATAHLDSMTGPLDTDLWVQSLLGLRTASLASAQDHLRALTATLPYQARVFVQERLLRDWALEVGEQGNEARSERYLGEAAVIGTVLLKQFGDRLIAEEVARLRMEAAEQHDPQSLRSLAAAGHVSYARGMQAYREQRLQEASLELARAASHFSRAGSDFELLSLFYLADCGYYTDLSATSARLLDLEKRVDRHQLPYLAGQIQWRLGVIDALRGQKGEALARYQEGTELLAASSGEKGSVFGEVMAAEVLDQLGDIGPGWNRRLPALQALAFSGDHRRDHSMLSEAAEALLRHGQPALAQPFLAELAENAEEWGVPAARAFTLRESAANDAELGRLSEARAEVERARQAVSQMPPGSMRDRVASSIGLISAMARVEEEPEAALKLMDMEFAQQRTAGDLYYAVPYWTRRARAHSLLGDRRSMREDLFAAIGFFEEVRCSTADYSLKAAAFEQAQPAFDQLIDLLEHEGESAAAFALADLSRSRLVRELRSGAAGCRAGLTAGSPKSDLLPSLQARLPPRVLLVQYAVLPERLLAWVVERDAWREVEVAIPRRQLEREVDLFRQALESSAPEPVVRRRGGDLYQHLVAPLGLPARDDRSLVILPDRTLARIPFSALFDRTSERYLIEERPVSIMASASLLQRSLRPPARPTASEASVLVVAVPQAAGIYATLPMLKDAAEESRGVLAAYPSGALLSGPTASPDHLMEQARSHSVLHFAGHALANPEDAYRSLLLLAPSERRPDGELAAEEILTEDLSPLDLVVLAGCRTSEGFRHGRENRLGLAEAFLAAGARNVVASLWDVNDQASHRLMVRFHRHWQASHVASLALRNAILESLGLAGDPAAKPREWAAYLAAGL